MRKDTRTDRAPWLLLPAVFLALSGVTLLAPRQAAQAAPPTPSKPAATALDDDGDGDELLEHWGDPKYAREERLQIAGMAGGFLLLGGLTYRRRVKNRPQAAHLISGSAAKQELPEQRKAA